MGAALRIDQAAGPGPGGPALTAQEFQRVRELIRTKAGISLAESKRSMVYSRLLKRLRATGSESFSDYLDALERSGDAEIQSFVNALTTNLTSFFREGYHFPLLASHLRTIARPGRPASIWCAAASTGEEPYSIAITAIQALGPRPPVSIFASDIDTEVLERARRGVYPIGAVEVLEPARRGEFFLRGLGANDGSVRVRPEVARLVTFGQFNLVSDQWAFREPFDVIFCRNVLIYFDGPTKDSVLSRMHRALRPGGLLFVGHSENLSEQRSLFDSQGKTVYRRID